MDMKHYVIVNFLSWQSTGWDRKIEDPLLEEQRIATLRKYLLPSLERQTDTDFTLLLYIGRQLSTKTREILGSLETSFPVIIGESSLIDAEIEKAWTDNDVVITSKMADDDMPWTGASEEVKRIASEGLPLVVHGYRKGIVYVEGRGITKWRFPNDYGQLAIFMSLIRTTEANPMTINTLGNHGDVKNTVERDYLKYGLSELPEGWWNSDDTTYPAWCYVRHKNAIFGHRDKWKVLNPDLSPLKKYFGFEPHGS